MNALGDVTQLALCVALDIRHPLAYLALGPALALASESAIDVDWLPIEGLLLRRPSSPAADDDRGVRHTRHRAHMIGREIDVYAQAQGLILREPYRHGSARAAHAAWLWARERAPDALPALLEELFRRYWALELDAGDLDDVVAVVREVGLDGAAFADWAAVEGEGEVARVAAALRDAGIYQTPAYLVEDQLFYGRQHLPMIRWILAGRSGPPPI